MSRSDASAHSRFLRAVHVGVLNASRDQDPLPLLSAHLLHRGQVASAMLNNENVQPT